MKKRAIAIAVAAACLGGAGLSYAADKALTINGNTSLPSFNSVTLTFTSNGDITITTDPEFTFSGEADRDGDGVPDSSDACPDYVGGSVDADGDGFCAFVVGSGGDQALADFNDNDPRVGPDRDGDGVPDVDDAYPDDPNLSAPPSGTDCNEADPGITCGPAIDIHVGSPRTTIILPSARIPAGATGNTSQYTDTLRRRFVTNSSTTAVGQLGYVPDGTALTVRITAPDSAEAAVLASDPACTLQTSFVGRLGWTTIPGATSLCDLKPNTVYFLDMEITGTALDGTNAAYTLQGDTTEARTIVAN